MVQLWGNFVNKNAICRGKRKIKWRVICWIYTSLPKLISIVKYFSLLCGKILINKILIKNASTEYFVLFIPMTVLQWHETKTIWLSVEKNHSDLPHCFHTEVHRAYMPETRLTSNFAVLLNFLNVNVKISRGGNASETYQVFHYCFFYNVDLWDQVLLGPSASCDM